MGRNYRAELRARGIWVDRRSRGPQPPDDVLIRDLWRRLTDGDKAQFMIWAEVWQGPPLRPLEPGEEVLLDA